MPRPSPAQAVRVVCQRNRGLAAGAARRIFGPTWEGHGMRLRFVRSARVGLVVAVAACGQPAPPTGSFDHLFAPPEGRFQHVSSTDTSGGNHDFVEIPAGDSPVLLDTPGSGIVRRLWATVSCLCWQ